MKVTIYLNGREVKPEELEKVEITSERVKKIIASHLKPTGKKGA